MSTFALPQHNYAEVNGVRLHYVSEGNGPLILFVHGFPEFWYEWRRQIPEFARDQLAVALDMRGYNLSSRPADVEQYEMPLLVEDLAGLIRHLNQQTAVVVGHDWGGSVAWAFAIAHPELVDKLVIINAPHPAIFQRELRSNPAQQKASQYMLMFRSPDAEGNLSAGRYRPFAERLFGENVKKGLVSQSEIDAYVEAWSRPGGLTGGLNYYRAAKIGPPPEGTAPTAKADPGAYRVKVPTLVIWGEKDTALLPGNLEGLEEYVPDLRIERIADGSHWVIQEKPDRVNALIRAFL